MTEKEKAELDTLVTLAKLELEGAKLHFQNAQDWMAQARNELDMAKSTVERLNKRIQEVKDDEGA